LIRHLNEATIIESTSDREFSSGFGFLMHFFTQFLKMAVVFCVHVAVTIALYRGRVMGDEVLFQSDAVIFLLPFVIALLVYAGFLWRSGVPRPGRCRRLKVAAIAFGLSVVSFLVGLTVSLNLYGS
jgi:hypothetical protein